jgi:hypothetical protein
MWSSVAVVGLLWALNPGVLGVIVLLISRPRGVQNLVAYWCGSLMVCIPLLLIPVMMLYYAPTSASFAHNIATPANPLARQTQIGLGLLTLSIAAVVAARFMVRRRRQSLVITPVRGGAADAVGSDDVASDKAEGNQSTFRRLVRRVYKAWEDGSLWISFVFGMMLFPGPPVALFVVTTIAGSGAPIGIQVTAAVAFVVVMLGLVETILVSYLVAPGRTQQLLRPLHDWSRTYRVQVTITILVIVGMWQLARGVGVV